jgi:hypothetical protein
MINLDFISNSNNNIFNQFYELTDGKIIIGGSSVLKYHNIINRKVGNLNLVLDVDDAKYFTNLQNYYKFTFVGKQKFGLISEVYWFENNGIGGVFFLQNSTNFDIIEFDNQFVRIQKISDIRLNKLSLVENGDTNSIKHYGDVEMIDKFYGNASKKNII